MKRVACFALFLSVLAGFGIAAAQQASQAPHQVLVITREFVKPGRGGMIHDKAESGFVQAVARAKWPTYYVGMTSLSGKQRALFFVGYDSFEAWEKDNMAVQKNSALSAAVDHAGFVDGDLLDSMDAAAFTYREDYSLRPNADLSHRRYMEVALYHVRPGHRKEWDEGVKMVLAAYKKAMPEDHWACYEVMYGLPEGTFIFLTARTSTAEIDQGFAHNKDFMAAMGEEGMKKLDELSAASIESNETNLFALNPRMSYVADEVIKADPFWNAKPAAAATPAAHKKAGSKAAAQ
jgi:hypothetical protein